MFWISSVITGLMYATVLSFITLESSFIIQVW